MNLKFELNWQPWFGVSAVVLLAGLLGLGWMRHSRSLPDIAGRSQKIHQAIYRDDYARTSEGEWLILNQVTNPFKKEGILAYRRGDYKEAARLFQNSLAFDRDPEALIYFNNARVNQAAEYVTIAVAVTLSDDQVTGSAKEVLRGVAQAQKELIEAGNNVKVIIGDDDNRLESVESLAQQFVDNPEVRGVIGHYTSDLSMAAGEIYQEAGLVMITPIAAALSVTELGEFIFRSTLNNYQLSDSIVEYLRDEFQSSHVALFYSSRSSYSLPLKVLVAEQLTAMPDVDISIVDVDQPDFDVAVAFDGFEGKGIDAIALLVDVVENNYSTEIMTENQRRSQLPMIGGDDGIYNDWTSATDAAVSEGLVVPVIWHALTNPSALFPVTSRELWEQTVSWRTAMAYDAAKSLMTALRETQDYSRLAVQQILSDPSFGVQGAATSVTYTQSGDRLAEATLVKVVADPQAPFGYSFLPILPDPTITP